MPMPIDNLTLHCPAKLNLTLAVGPPRSDGLHPIASVMVAIDFGDDLHLRKSSNTTSTFARRFTDDAPKPQPIDWPIETDLVYRAHARLEQAVGRALPVVCDVLKRIPAGAGLGGGSSNAAGMLVGLRQLFDLAIEDDKLLLIANQLGADVAFAVYALLGRRAAIVTGIGEVIQPIDHLPAFDAVLVFPDGACPTAAVYRAFDQLDPNRPPLLHEPLVDTWSQPMLPTARNDLTDAAIKCCPPITTAIQTIKTFGLAPRLTGSGSSLFAIVESQANAIAIAEKLRQAGLSCTATSFS